MSLNTSAVGGDFTSQVVLSDGSIAGEGSGPTPESAAFWAVSAAVRSENPRFVTAGYGHAIYLDEQGQRSIAAYRAIMDLVRMKGA